MRRDIIIGIFCSLLIHVGLGFGGELNLDFLKKKTKVVAKEEAPTIEIVMPKLEPEPPAPAESDSSSSSDSVSLAPPSVADTPGVVDTNSFVQPVQPPPPPTSGIAMTVPKNSGPVATSSVTQVFDLASLDQQPAPSFQVQATYPYEMKRQGVTATVVVEFICTDKGEVRDARVIKSDNQAFEAATLEAIYKWKFRPGKKGGRAVSARMQQPFLFAINE